MLNNCQSLFEPFLVLLRWVNRLFFSAHLVLVIMMVSLRVVMMLKLTHWLLLMPNVCVVKSIQTLYTLKVYAFRK